MSCWWAGQAGRGQEETAVEELVELVRIGGLAMLLGVFGDGAHDVVDCLAIAKFWGKQRLEAEVVAQPVCETAGAVGG